MSEMFGKSGATGGGGNLLVEGEKRQPVSTRSLFFSPSSVTITSSPMFSSSPTISAAPSTFNSSVHCQRPKVGFTQRLGPVSSSGEKYRGGYSQLNDKDIMTEDLFYLMRRPRLGTAVVINNLNTEQEPTKKDVEAMATVLKDIGFDVEIHRDLNSQGMNSVKRKITNEGAHKDANCFLLLIISHGTADNFLLDKDGNKTWNIESLVTEVCDIQALVGKPKLFFIEACRGKEQNQGMAVMSKSTPIAPSSGITLPSKQDVFVGFATVPGYVSLTASGGSPYLQALAVELSQHFASTHLSDIHLLVKRKLAVLRLGADGVTQGAEERSSLLSKLLFSRYQGSHKGTIKDGGGKSTFNFFHRSSSPLSSSLLSSSSAVTKPSTLSSTSSFTSTSPFTSISPFTSTSSNRLSNSITCSPPSPISAPNGLNEDRMKPSPLSRSTTGPVYPGLAKPNSIFSSSVVGKEKPRPASQIFVSMSGSPKARPRSIMFPASTVSVSRSSSSPSAAAASSVREQDFMKLYIDPSQKTTNVHRVEIHSSDTEGGLNRLLNKVKEVYGGEGKVKVKKKNKDKVFSFKYKGPERATLLLETALKNIRELQSKSDLWKYTQTLEVTTVN